MNKDLGTTILGGITAAATAAGPVVQMANGSWNATSIFQLVAAIGLGLLGFFTNKQ